MKTLKTILAIFCFIALSISLNAQNTDGDLILGTGNKQFIFHTQMFKPTDPPVVFIAPKLSNGTFDWSKQIILKNDGSLLMSAGNLDVAGTTQTDKLLVNHPNNIGNWNNNWNNIWQSGFYDSQNALNAPESSGWFWGINMGHGSNNPNYRFGGQIAIKNDPTSPTMYFRSIYGDGIWAKVLHNTGDQKINGKLDVNGTIHAREVIVDVNFPPADFVFEEDYALRPLNEVSDFIQANKHLPEIPSAADMLNNGLDMGEFQMKLLQKIEELTLYVIEQDKQLKKQQEEINRLKSR